MSTYDTLWKAAPDVFVVSAPAEELVEAAADIMSALRLVSHDPTMTFLTHLRRTEASAGPAMIVSDVAEWEDGERHTAVVVSLVIDADATPGGARRAVIRTHLEDDHTRLTGSTFEFEEHHDLIRAGLVDAIRRVDPGALHVEAPVRPESDQAPVAAITIEPARRREPEHAADIMVFHASGLDAWSFAGLGLMAVGVAAMVLAVAAGTFQLAVGGVAFGLCLGWLGSRLDAR